MPFWMLNPYWQMSGVWAGTIYGNPTQQSEAWHRPIFGKLIQIRAFSRKIILNELRGVTQIWMNFPENGLAHTHSTNTEVLMKFLWMSFPEIDLGHAPENWNFGEISGWVIQDMPIRVKQKGVSKGLPQNIISKALKLAGFWSIMEV